MQIKDYKRIIVADGPMGTMIQSSGLDPAVCPELWNEKDPAAIEKIHQAYIDSGSDLVGTNTFGSSPIKLKEYGLADQAYELSKKGAEIVRRLATDRVVVAGAVGPTGGLLKPMGDLDFEDVVEAYRVQVKGLIDGGADVILVETMMEITELKAAVLATRDIDPNIEIIGQMTFTESGTTVMGTTPEVAATVMESLGVDYLGVNCSTGPEGLLSVVQRMGKVTHLPLSVQPNAGLPEIEDGRMVYRETPAHMASFVADFVKAGAGLVGGCCGNTPAHIAAIAKATSGLSRVERLPAKHLGICSRNRRVVPGQAQIGVAKLALNSETKFHLEANEARPLLKYLRKQIKNTPEVAAVCLDTGGVNLSPELVEGLMLGLKGPLCLPLLVSVSVGGALERILRLATGNVMLTDVSQEILPSILTLARQYGASLALRLQGTEDEAEVEAMVKTCHEGGIPSARLSLDLGRALKKSQVAWLQEQELRGFSLLVQQEEDMEQDFSLLTSLDEKVWVVADFTNQSMKEIF